MAAPIGCATVMPSAECVGRHGPEELRHQLLRPANVVSERLAMDTRLISVEVHEPQLRLVGNAHVCSLRGICLRLSRRDAFALQRHWRPVTRRLLYQHLYFDLNTGCSGLCGADGNSSIIDGTLMTCARSRLAKKYS